MEKVIIRNLGAIKDIQIDIKPFTVLVGQSGVGKSIILRTIGMLKWFYKRMQYKNLLKETKTNSNALRFRLDRILKTSLLDDFFTSDTYIEYIKDDISIITIQNNKLTPNYKNAKKNEILMNKIVFLNDIRSSLPELLSSPSAQRAKLSYYTSDLIDNFIIALDNFKKYSLKTMDISLISKKTLRGKEFFILNQNNEIRFENSSSGEKNISILELICSYFAKEYNFTDGFSKAIIELITQQLELKNIQNLYKYMKNNNFSKSLNLLIEEPEVNLYPTQQKAITYFLASLKYTKNTPNIILSTHSPYILASLNNLLYANEVIKNNPQKEQEVYNIINKDNILDINEFAIYEIKDGNAYSLIDEQMNIINIDILDGVSEEITKETDLLIKIDV